MAFDEMVTTYVRDHRAEMRFFEIHRSFASVIRHAALYPLPSGRRHPHQRRVA